MSRCMKMFSRRYRTNTGIRFDSQFRTRRGSQSPGRNAMQLNLFILFPCYAGARFNAALNVNLTVGNLQISLGQGGLNLGTEH
jgi:hypothetical protein